LLGNNVPNRFLFVLCPPFSGSTVLTRILMSSPNVSVNNHLSNNEGQFLPELSDIMRKSIWNVDAKYPWPTIKKVWQLYWDKTKPILLEKSPPNLIRALEIEEHFENAFFLISIRNPYAFCEGVIRRKVHDPITAAKFWLKCAVKQRQNHSELSQSFLITYEDLVDHPSDTCKKIIARLPDLSSLDYQSIFKVHNVENRDCYLQNFNTTKIKNLSPSQIQSINSVLAGEENLLNYFGYKLISVNGFK